MPTYAYACPDCGHRFEVVQSIHHESLKTCPECSGAIRRVIGAVGVTFKGSGFYRTDSRSGRSSTDHATATTEGAASTSGASDKGGAGKGDTAKKSTDRISGSSSGSSGTSPSAAPTATPAATPST